MKCTGELKVLKNDNELLKKQIENMQENQTLLFNEKQKVDVDLDVDKLQSLDV